MYGCELFTDLFSTGKEMNRKCLILQKASTRDSDSLNKSSILQHSMKECSIEPGAQ